MGCATSKKEEDEVEFNHNPTRTLTGGENAAQDITDVSQLRFEKGLKYLDLANNKIVVVSGLTLPEGLERLLLFSNKIVDVSCITKKSCPNLTRLDLSHNPISQAEVDRIRDWLDVR